MARTKISAATPAATSAFALSRREFLAASAGALLVTVTADGAIGTASAATLPPTGTDPVGKNLGGYVLIAPDGTITVLYGGAEMGQGGSTGIAQGVAEELGAKWSDVTVQSAPVGGAWTTGPTWLTGGSNTVRSYLGRMRVAGAAAREMLIAAAAAQWGVAATGLVAVDSTVKDPTNAARVATFASLVDAARLLPIPTDPPVGRMPAIYVGQSMARLDIPAKTNGSALYGIDVTPKVDPRLAVTAPTATSTGMLYAVVRNAPVAGGTLKATPSIPAGASAVVNLGDACAVVASNTWAAIMAAKQLSASWTTPADAAARTSSTIATTAQTLMASGTPLVAEGDPAAAATAVGTTPTIDATYSVPYLAHVPMEVPNATVLPVYTLGLLTSIEIWLPTQAADWVRSAVATASGLNRSAVTVHSTLLGGGFGRKIETDYAVHAVKTALGLKKPVKVIWPREEDVSHDVYRPMALARVRATLAQDGSIAGWSNRIVTQGIMYAKKWQAAGVDSSAVENATTATGVPYAYGTKAVEWVPLTVGIPVGFWRSVGASINTFVVESAVDELAKAAGVDEYQFRRRLLLAAKAAGNTKAQRFLDVLDAAATLGGWSTAPATGRARGISMTTCFDSIVAEVVEVSQPSLGVIKVEKVAVAYDCGPLVVNPNAVEAQLQGGVAYALSAALWDRITFTSGKADQNNFSKYRMVKGKDMPAIATQRVVPADTALPVGGVGEIAVPGVAPAVVTAWAKLTGTRIRALPMFPGATMGG